MEHKEIFDIAEVSSGGGRFGDLLPHAGLEGGVFEAGIDDVDDFQEEAAHDDEADPEFDTLSIANDGAFVVDENSIIKLYFENNDASLWAGEGAEYKLVSDDGFASGTIDLSDLLSNFNDLFGLEGRTDGLYLIGLGAGPIPPGPGPDPGSGVPEPSTWALLALGVIVLFLRKRVRS